MLTYNKLEDIICNITDINMKGIRKLLFYAPWGWGWVWNDNKLCEDNGEFKSVETALNAATSKLYTLTDKLKAKEPVLFHEQQRNEYVDFFKSAINSKKIDSKKLECVKSEIINSLKNTDDIDGILSEDDDDLLDVITNYTGNKSYIDQLETLVNIVDVLEFIFYAFLLSVRWANAIIAYRKAKNKPQKNSRKSFDTSTIPPEKILAFYKDWLWTEEITKDIEKKSNEVWIVTPDFRYDKLSNENYIYIVKENIVEKGCKYRYIYIRNRQNESIVSDMEEYYFNCFKSKGKSIEDLNEAMKFLPVDEEDYPWVLEQILFFVREEEQIYEKAIME